MILLRCFRLDAVLLLDEFETNKAFCQRQKSHFVESPQCAICLSVIEK